MSANCETGAVEAVVDDLFTPLRLILSVESEARTDSAIKGGVVKIISIKTGTAIICSDAGFTLCHVAVGAVESFGGVIVNKVLI